MLSCTCMFSFAAVVDLRGGGIYPSFHGHITIYIDIFIYNHVNMPNDRYKEFIEIQVINELINYEYGFFNI